jgi:hydrogenase maturation protein HypF
MIQGVGFRPYVNRLAQSMRLSGWVANSGEGVTVEVEGAGDAVEEFRRRLGAQLPPLARLDRVHADELAPAGYTTFTIRPSTDTAAPTALVVPDVATCDDCLNEISNPADRRYRYPFPN